MKYSRVPRPDTPPGEVTAGIDWASADHAVCMVDAAGVVVSRFTVAHTAEGLRALVRFADGSRHASPWAAKTYHDAIARGKDHPCAVRILARAWLYVSWNAGTTASPTTRPATVPSSACSPPKTPARTRPA